MVRLVNYRSRKKRSYSMGKIQTIESGGAIFITLNADTGSISAGGAIPANKIAKVGETGQDGELSLSDAFGHPAVHLNRRHLFWRTKPVSGQPLGAVMLMLDAETPELRLFGSSGNLPGQAKDAT